MVPHVLLISRRFFRSMANRFGHVEHLTPLILHPMLTSVITLDAIGISIKRPVTPKPLEAERNKSESCVECHGEHCNNV